MPKQNTQTYRQAQSEKHKGFQHSKKSADTVSPNINLLIGLITLLEQVTPVKTSGTYYDITPQVTNFRSPSLLDLPYYGNLGLQLTVTKNDNSTGTPVTTNQTVLGYQHTINTYTYQKVHTTTTGTGSNRHTTTFYTTENYASYVFMNTLFDCLTANAVRTAYLPIAALLFTHAQETPTTIAFNQPYTQGAQMYGSVSNLPLSALTSIQNAQLNLFNGCINVAAAEQRKFAAIIGGVVGGVALIACIAAIVFHRRNRSRGISFNTPYVANHHHEPAATPELPVLFATSEELPQVNRESLFGNRSNSPLSGVVVDIREERPAFETV